MARVSNKIGSCPAPDCGGGYPYRQRSLVPQEVSQLEEAGLSGAEMLKRCSYCGCIYRPHGYQNGITAEPKIFGYLDSMLGPGWHSKQGL